MKLNNLFITIIKKQIRNYHKSFLERSCSNTTKMPFRGVTHVIFDMDGLLLDTEHIHEEIFKEIAKSFGKPFPFDVRMKVLGASEKLTLNIIVNELQLPITQDDLKKRCDELGTKYLGDVLLLRGAEKLIRHLYDSNVPIALATSSGADMVKLKTEKHQQVFSLFHHKVMGSSDPEVIQGKPSPDIFLVAARRFSHEPKPENCLVFEDSPNGVKAARTAGMQVVMVPDEHCPVEQRKEATVVLKSLEEFNLEDFGLPPYK